MSWGRWLLPYRMPTPWAAWLRERRAVADRVKFEEFERFMVEYREAYQPAPLRDDDGRPIRVRGQVWYDLPTADDEE